MNRTFLILFILGIFGIGAAVAWYLIDSRNQAFGPIPEKTLPEPSEGSAIYTNGPHGFTLMYPQSAEVSYEFSPSYNLGTSWRANALPTSTGDPLVSILTYSVSSEDSYPRYFNALVRVGASTSPEELARCEIQTEDAGETALPDRVINGQTWKAFSFEDAAMMQYVRGISYRTVHEGTCVAMEQVRTGSNYRDDPPSNKDIPDTTLENEYNALDVIVSSVVFVR